MGHGCACAINCNAVSLLLFYSNNGYDRDVLQRRRDVEQSRHRHRGAHRVGPWRVCKTINYTVRNNNACIITTNNTITSITITIHCYDNKS